MRLNVAWAAARISVVRVVDQQREDRELFLRARFEPALRREQPHVARAPRLS